MNPVVDPMLCAEVIYPDPKLPCDVEFRSCIGELYPFGQWIGLVNDYPVVRLERGRKEPYVLPHKYYRIFHSNPTNVALRREPFNHQKHGNILAKQLRV